MYLVERNCVRWQYLSNAQKFGTIFSIAVVTVILAFISLFYWGRVISLRQSQARRRPSHRRIPITHHTSGLVALPGFVYQPTMTDYVAAQMAHGPQPPQQQFFFHGPQPVYQHPAFAMRV